MAGIEELKDVLESGAKLTILIKALKDGVGLDDLDEAIAFATTLPDLVSGIKDVPMEIEDLDDSERVEINKMLDDLGIAEGDKNEAFKHFVQAGLHAGQGVLLLKEEKPD